MVAFLALTASSLIAQATEGNIQEVLEARLEEFSSAQQERDTLPLIATSDHQVAHSSQEQSINKIDPSPPTGPCKCEQDATLQTSHIKPAKVDKKSKLGEKKADKERKKIDNLDTTVEIKVGDIESEAPASMEHGEQSRDTTSKAVVAANVEGDDGQPDKAVEEKEKLVQEEAGDRRLRDEKSAKKEQKSKKRSKRDTKGGKSKGKGKGKGKRFTSKTKNDKNNKKNKK